MKKRDNNNNKKITDNILKHLPNLWYINTYCGNDIQIERENNIVIDKEYARIDDFFLFE